MRSRKVEERICVGEEIEVKREECLAVEREAPGYRKIAAGECGKIVRRIQKQRIARI